MTAAENGTRAAADTAATPVLSIEGLRAGYGKKEVVHGVDLALNDREILLMLGHNGAGTKPLVATVFGPLRAAARRVRFQGADIPERKPSGKFAARNPHDP